MKAIINFLIRNIYVIVFLLLEGVALTLVIGTNPFQRGTFLASSNAITGRLYGVSNSVTEYFGLQRQNDNLAEENTALKNQIERLKEQLATATDTVGGTFSLPAGNNATSTYNYVSAKLINKTTGKIQNYLMLNKGAKDGIRPKMGVVCSEGLVGVVSSVSKHFSVVLPIINSKSKVSSLLKRGGYVGSLSWDGQDPRYALLDGIPRHVSIAVGDTLVTSGYSAIFPENLLIGTVHKFKKENAGNNYYVQVKLSTDFYSLSHVNVIRYQYQAERETLENLKTPDTTIN